MSVCLLICHLKKLGANLFIVFGQKLNIIDMNTFTSLLALESEISNAKKTNNNNEFWTPVFPSSLVF